MNSFPFGEQWNTKWKWAGKNFDYSKKKLQYLIFFPFSKIWLWTFEWIFAWKRISHTNIHHQRSHRHSRYFQPPKKETFWCIYINFFISFSKVFTGLPNQNIEHPSFTIPKERVVETEISWDKEKGGKFKMSIWNVFFFREKNLTRCVVSQK